MTYFHLENIGAENFFTQTREPATASMALFYMKKVNIMRKRVRSGYLFLLLLQKW